MSWNLKFIHDYCGFSVTLHVSVWVEISNIRAWPPARLVTLHVSVWVEICYRRAAPALLRSRSTWACELKFSERWYVSGLRRSRSTWACELKYFVRENCHYRPSHAPRERVSWNMLIACLLCAFIRHAPRERVSWNFCTVSKICATHRHAPRERVSWNTRHHWWTSNELVTLHVSVWVEIKSADNIGHISIGHAPRERVSWNCWQVRWTWFLQGHAPRERVSWNVTYLLYIVFHCRHAPRERVSWNTRKSFAARTTSCHAPRERVSWNCRRDRHIWRCDSHAPRERVSWNPIFSFLVTKNVVTLHVSVWVEMTCLPRHFSNFSVTLHVSVWVEIANQCHAMPLPLSRSTWACELKFDFQGIREFFNRVTLHVSVWVEMQICSAAFRKPFVTLHVSVWVEMTTWKSWQIFSARSRSTWACELKCMVCNANPRVTSHAPRERVSWN